MNGEKTEEKDSAVGEIGAKGENRVADGNKNDGEDYFRVRCGSNSNVRRAGERRENSRWFIPAVKCDGNVSPPSLFCYAKIVES